MEERKGRRSAYVNARQKKLLIQFVANHPELITCRVTQDFNYRDSQKLWQEITNECNSISGGARKTWKQWRKTWQDLRSKTKKRQAEIGDIPSSVVMLTSAEQEALGLNLSGMPYPEESTEFVQLEQDNNMPDSNFENEEDSTPSHSEPESPPEVKVFAQKVTKIKNSSKHSSKNPNNCYFNCDLLAVHEQRKIQIKEDYLSFKKDYLRQKLKILKEQTEALKTIARELCDKK